MADFHERLRGLLLEENARIDGIYHCPHHPEGEVERYRRACDCRRPGSGLFDRARDEMGIDLGRSFLLADSEAALRSAVAAGVQPILVRAGTIDEAVNLALSRNTPSEATTR
ncbi:MAG: HAD hydrolase-like protein [Acidobacteria bacterium]|nr:HAD hydrolase-like protein [Acidobacteriota bacterium]NIM60786.1 HAD hydrolase-like protein [Acidobacteriota bacterium]NIQ83471.1 HAD hydrolase-like protein [Acidobacteriota bacterium]NIT09712.1 HAD hydrolase-like protein [Acidobacteriota bacterium]